MKEKLIELAKKVYSQKDIIPVYQELLNFFNEKEMYHEVGGLLEKIWHINQNHQLYEQIGDIFLNKVRDFDIAFAAYNRYLQYAHPRFFKNYVNTLDKLGDQFFKYEEDDEDYSREIINICDRYHTLVYIMVCLAQNKEYEAILKIKEYLIKLRNKIESIAKEDDKSAVDDLKDSDNHLSDVLSEILHHNDINRFAIELNQKNEQAYINIICDLLTYKYFDEALEYYNNYYSEPFEKEKTNGISDLCWIISDYFSKNFDFFDAILFQKMALEQDGALEK